MLHSPAALALTLTALLICEPAVCQDGSTEQWIRELGDAELQQRAADALVRAGEPAVPLLVEVAADDSASNAARTLALRALAEIGPGAAVHAAELLDLGPTLSPDLFVTLWQTIASLAPYTELVLGMESLTVEPLGRATPEQQRAVLDGWWRARARRRLAADASVEELIQHLEHDDAYLRELAAELLARRGAAASAAVPALEKALAEQHPLARVTGAVDVHANKSTVGITRFHAAGRSIDESIHALAARALLAIDPAREVSAAAHAHRLRFGSRDDRMASAMALGRMQAAGSVPALVIATLDPELRVAYEAVTALGMIGPTAETAVPALESLVADGDEQQRRRARSALRQIRGD